MLPIGGVAAQDAVITEEPDVAGLGNLHSRGVRLAENGYRATGSNWSRYMNPELDRLIDTYLRTIPEPARISVLGGIVQHVAEQLPVIGLYYGWRSDAYTNRLVNVGTRWSGLTGTSPSWDAQVWDVRG